MQMLGTKRPGWFILLLGMLILWGVAGCTAFFAHVFYGPSIDPNATDWDRAYFDALPGWFAWDYGLAVGAGLAGSLAMLLRSRLAWVLYVLSLIAVLVQFGYVFAATDLMAHKGAMATLPFPLFIVAMAVLQLWLASYAHRKHWIS